MAKFICRPKRICVSVCKCFCQSSFCKSGGFKKEGLCIYIWSCQTNSQHELLSVEWHYTIYYVYIVRRFVFMYMTNLCSTHKRRSSQQLAWNGSKWKTMETRRAFCGCRVCQWNLVNIVSLWQPFKLTGGICGVSYYYLRIARLWLCGASVFRICMRRENARTSSDGNIASIYSYMPSHKYPFIRLKVERIASTHPGMAECARMCGGIQIARA